MDKKLLGMVALMLLVAVLFISIDLTFYLIFIEPLLMMALLGVVGVNKISISIVLSLFFAGVFYILSANHRLQRVLEFFS